MRKLLTIIGCVALTACASYARSRYVPFTVSVGTEAQTTNTQTRPIIGYIEEVHIENASEANVTSTVTFTKSPAVGTNLTTTVIYTNTAQSASVIARPRVTPTDDEGSALTNLTVRERILCTGDPVTFSVIQTTEVTGVVFRAWLKISD